MYKIDVFPGSGGKGGIFHALNVNIMFRIPKINAGFCSRRIFLNHKSHVDFAQFPGTPFSEEQHILAVQGGTTEGGGCSIPEPRKPPTPLFAAKC